MLKYSLKCQRLALPLCFKHTQKSPAIKSHKAIFVHAEGKREINHIIDSQDVGS